MHAHASCRQILPGLSVRPVVPNRGPSSSHWVVIQDVRRQTQLGYLVVVICHDRYHGLKLWNARHCRPLRSNESRPQPSMILDLRCSACAAGSRSGVANDHSIVPFGRDLPAGGKMPAPIFVRIPACIFLFWADHGCSRHGVVQKWQSLYH